MPDINPSTFRLIGSQAPDGDGRRLPDASVQAGAIAARALVDLGVLDVQFGTPADGGLDETKLLLDTSASPPSLKQFVGAAWGSVMRSTLAALGIFTGFLPMVDDYAAFKALPGEHLARYTRVMVRGDRGGVFDIRSGTEGAVTAALAADPREGVRVALTNGGGIRYGHRVSERQSEFQADWFETIGDGETDDWAAHQAAVNFCGSTVQKKQGGVVVVGASNYGIGQAITLDVPGVTLVGPVAWGNLLAYEDPEDDEAGALVGTGTTGAVVWLKAPDTRAVGLTIQASEARKEAAITTNLDVNAGIFVGAADGVGGNFAAYRNLVQDCIIRDQPADGIHGAGAVTYLTLYRNTVTGCGRKGITVDCGNLGGRVNKQRPGIIKVVECKATDCLGEGLAIGNPDDTNALFPYRPTVNEFESFRNASDAGARYQNFGTYIFGEEVRINGCGFAGTDENNAAIRGDLYIAGRDLLLMANRFVAGTAYLKIDEVDGSGVTTEIVHVQGGRSTGGPSGGGSFFAEIHPNVRSVWIGDISNSPESMTNTTSIAGPLTTVKNGIISRYNSRDRNYNPSNAIDNIDNLRYRPPISLNNNKAGYIDFGGAAYGKAIISGNVAVRGYAEIHFRVGALAFIDLLQSGSGVPVTVGTSALGDAGGTDTHLNIAVDPATNRLYISNRTGNASYTIAFEAMGGDAGTAPADFVKFS